MPSKSAAQHNFMEGCKHNPQHMNGKCPPAKVSKEFVAADENKAQLSALEKKK